MLTTITRRRIQKLKAKGRKLSKSKTKRKRSKKNLIWWKKILWNISATTCLQGYGLQWHVSNDISLMSSPNLPGAKSPAFDFVLALENASSWHFVCCSLALSRKKNAYIQHVSLLPWAITLYWGAEARLPCSYGFCSNFKNLSLIHFDFRISNSNLQRVCFISLVRAFLKGQHIWYGTNHEIAIHIRVRINILLTINDFSNITRRLHLRT